MAIDDLPLPVVVAAGYVVAQKIEAIATRAVMIGQPGTPFAAKIRALDF